MSRPGPVFGRSRSPVRAGADDGHGEGCGRDDEHDLGQGARRTGNHSERGCPGATRTATNGSSFEVPGLAEQIAGMTALDRLGRPDDIAIAEVVAFLASDAARWITGQIIDASGGLFLARASDRRPSTRRTRAPGPGPAPQIARLTRRHSEPPMARPPTQRDRRRPSGEGGLRGARLSGRLRRCPQAGLGRPHAVSA